MATELSPEERERLYNQLRENPLWHELLSFVDSQKRIADSVVYTPLSGKGLGDILHRDQMTGAGWAFNEMKSFLIDDLRKGDG